MSASVVGRDAELAVIDHFLAGVRDGASALVLEGEAGMGKTTLWRAAVADAEAAGFVVLRAQPAESETALSFSALGDLLDPVLEAALEPLAAGQRGALSRALVLDDAEGPAPDAHAVGVAVLNALRALSERSPVAVCVDDVQWLDAASAGALAYAGRRLGPECVGLLLARRSGVDSPLLDDLRRAPLGDRLVELRVVALDVAALHQVVHGRLDVVLPRPLLAEVHQASGGNPFFALEIVRALARGGVSVEAGRPLPVPDSLHDIVHGRLLALSDETRDFLAAAAAHAHPTVAITEAASGVSRDRGLEPAVAAQVVELDRDRIRFTHPLLTAGAYETADPRRRKEIHVRLAALLEDPEARAWQLAASVDEPDEDVARSLEEAAWGARDRGAPRPAALLLDRARELTPAKLASEASRRAVDAAYLHYEAGDSTRAEMQLREVIDDLPEGRERARALTRLARVRAYEALPHAAALFLQAVAEAGDDTETLAAAHLGVADCFWYGLENLEDAFAHATTATELALELGDAGLASEALGNRWTVAILLGHADVTAAGERALAAQQAAADRRILTQPRFISASDSMWLSGAFEEARQELLELLALARDVDESSVPLALFHLAHLESELGDLAGAIGHAREGQDAANQAGQRTSSAFNLGLESVVEARMGFVEQARGRARQALELVHTAGGRRTELLARSALGHLDLGEGSAQAAVESLEPLLTIVRGEGIVEPCAIAFVVDFVEALVVLGRDDQAVAELEWYEDAARRLDRPTALANCARCRGLLAAQAGDLDAALAAFDEALEWHAKVELPLDRGRTLLALGATQRRMKRRREARATLEEALGVFERIGAALWAERARAELRRISGRAATPGALTPAEERVAALVADGKTNKEVAAALFLSDRTVEGHLARIFGKLGIRQRTEVAQALQIRGSTGPNTGDGPVSAEASPL
jgi:DNA-binding CsgD family transcriptional regulator